MAGIGSVTQAMRAQRVLAQAAIYCRVEKMPQTNGRGCAYGVVYACPREASVAKALRASGIRARMRGAWEA